MDQLINHSSDTNVKPIMGNRDIEKNTETTYVKENHGFNYYTLEEVVNGIDGTEIENHFADIYNHLSTILSNENFESFGGDGKDFAFIFEINK